jgi:hypothetical protein
VFGAETLRERTLILLAKLDVSKTQLARRLWLNVDSKSQHMLVKMKGNS